MRPKKQKPVRQDELFRARLDQIINMKHELAVLADKIDWDWIDAELAPLFSDQGRPAEPVRFMIGMFLLKHIYALSDEQVVGALGARSLFPVLHRRELLPARAAARALRDEPLAQAHRRSSLEVLLAESLRIAMTAGALTKRDLARVTVDTTVQPKNVAFPTDAKLMETAIQQLAKLAKSMACRCASPMSGWPSGPR